MDGSVRPLLPGAGCPSRGWARVLHGGVGPGQVCRASTLLLAGVLLLALVGCRGPVRPDAVAWVTTWEEAQALVPAQSSLSTPPSAQECEQVLISLREIRSRLLPGPDELVGSEAAAWLARAEHMFFECFRPGHTDSVEVEYARLARLRTQVDEALATTLGAGAGDVEDPGRPSSARAAPGRVDTGERGSDDAVD